MKRQRKYTSREMIVRDIDAAHRKMKRLRAAAQDAAETAELAATMGNDVQCRNSRDESDRLWLKSNRIENTRLRKLGATLAMWDTAPLGVEGLSAEQVTLQKIA